MRNEDIYLMFQWWGRFTVKHFSGSPINYDEIEKDANTVLQRFKHPLNAAIMNAILDTMQGSVDT